MALVFCCDRCGEELWEPGAIISSPPWRNSETNLNLWTKYHICVNCWEAIYQPTLFDIEKLKITSILAEDDE